MVQTTQQTGKQWKGLGCIGSMMMIFGFLAMFGMFGKERVQLGIAALLIGLITALIGQVGKWWHHD